MSAAVTFDGLSELREALRSLPDDMVAEAGNIVEAAANSAAADIRSGYGFHSGALRNGVTATRRAGSNRLAASAIVISASPHAWIYDNGTAVRQTRRNANRGKMPERPSSDRMISKVIRIRARMVDELIALVKRAGFTVNE